ALELEEEALDRVAEVLDDHALRLLERKRTDVVLEPAQLRDDVRRHDVRTRREQLPELHEGRPELVEQLAEMPAPLGRPGLLRHRRETRLGAPARQQVRELVRLEEVAE